MGQLRRTDMALRVTCAQEAPDLVSAPKHHPVLASNPPNVSMAPDHQRHHHLPASAATLARTRTTT